MTKVMIHLFKSLAMPAAMMLALGVQAQEQAAEAAVQAPASVATETTAAPSVEPAPPTEKAKEQVVQEVSSLEDEMIGGIDWEGNIVYSVGDGVPPTNAVTPAQARVRAKRAAMDEAMARLLETAKAVQVDAQSTTRDFINESRVVNTAVKGLIRHAEVVELRQFDDGSYQIKMRMPLHDEKGLSGTLLPMALTRVPKAAIVTRTVRQETPTPAMQAVKTPVVTDKGQATGGREGIPEQFTALVVDATGLGANPAMFPRIVNRSGKVVYDLSQVDPNVAVQKGMCAYRKSLDKAMSLGRAGSNPMVVKASEVTGNSKVDLVLDDELAAKVADANALDGFLQQGKVIIVTD